MAKIGINIATGSIQQDEQIVGIDLGTTNSLIAIIHPESGQPVALKEHGKRSLVPSVIYFDESSNIVVGEEAREKLISHPERTIFSAKRLMGKSYKDISDHASFFSYSILEEMDDSLVKVRVGDRFFSPIDLSAYILKELKQRAEHILKTPVKKAVITVPAYFNDSQRQATRDAGKLAGLDVLRIINEPTAASLAYGLGIRTDEGERIIAVFDLGGGTFDVSMLRISGGVFEVLSTNGDTFLGGDDFDRAIAEYWIKTYGLDTKMLSANASAMQSLRLHAEAAKKQLSFADSFQCEFTGHSLLIRRDTFANLLIPFIERMMQCCKNALSDAGLAKKDIMDVVMVGGSTRISCVRQAVSEFFGCELLDTVDPDEVVALGAAVQADILAGKNKNNLLLDVTPLSLGIETSGGLMDVLIPRNTHIPFKASRQYTTQVDGQSGMRISVYQGERDLVKDNRKLAELVLSGIPAMPAGLPKVEVGFMINADGILTVSAKELRSGVGQHIEVKPQYGLTDGEVERMLLDSMANAQNDIAMRALTEARTEGEQLLKTTEKFLQKNASSITAEEMLATAEAMQALQLSLTMEDKDLIRVKMEALNDVSRPYAERVMDEAVSKAMAGKKI